MNKLNSLIVIILLAFVGCQKDGINSELITSENEKATIPYASENILKSFATNSEVIDYKLSKKMALHDLEDFKKETFEGKENLKLSDFPVIIYNKDKTPKFYEFIVSDKNNENIGTITCYAKKEIPGFTAYVLPFVRDYKKKEATKYTDLYPTVANQTDIERNSKREANTEAQIKLDNKAKAFWNSVDNRKELEKQNKNVSAKFMKAWSTYYTIPNFSNGNLLETRWTGGLGFGNGFAVAACWMYRAYHSSYKNAYYPLGMTFDASNDPLYQAFNPNVISVSSVFPNHRLSANTLKRASSSIKQDKPCILELKKGTQANYKVAFGTKDRYNTYKLFFFKIKKVHVDSWLRLSNNPGTGSFYMNTHRIIGNISFKSYELIRK